jgi:hypothetical protein
VTAATYTPTSDQLTEMWSTARIAWAGKDFPPYGSTAWAELAPDDPKRLASALTAAECWRRYGDEGALLTWLRDSTNRGPITLHQTRPYRPAPARPVQATGGWPPVAIPGRPGWVRTLTAAGRQVDMPANTRKEAAA